MLSLNRTKLLLGLLLLLRFLPVWTSVTVQSLTLNSSRLNVGVTLVSPSGYFELGIFPLKRQESNPGKYYYYLCIRYKAPIEQVITGVANRDRPLVSDKSYLELSNKDGNLKLFDPNNDANQTPWSSNTTNVGVVKLLDTGNLVLMDKSEMQIIWESFNNDNLSLTDTLLPGQHFYKTFTRNLTSWKTKDDPATGNGTYTFGWGIRGNVSVNMSILQLAWTSPTTFMNWTGEAYVPASLKDEPNPHIISNVEYVYFHETLGGLYFPSNPAPTAILSDFHTPSGNEDSSTTVLKRITLDTDGGFRIWQWKMGQDSKKWTPVANWVVYERGSQCYAIGTCGPFGLCKMPPPESLNVNVNGLVQCECPYGFEPLNKDDIARGCTAKVQLSDSEKCDVTKVRMITLTGTDMPWGGDNRTLIGPDSANCEEACLKDCYCTGATYSKDEGKCWIKNDKLYNLGFPTVALHGTDRVSFIKIAILQPDESPHKPDESPHKLGMIIGAALGGVLVMGLLLFCANRHWDFLGRNCGGEWCRQTPPNSPIRDFSGSIGSPPRTLAGPNSTGGI